MHGSGEMGAAGDGDVTQRLPGTDPRASSGDPRLAGSDPRGASGDPRMAGSDLWAARTDPWTAAPDPWQADPRSAAGGPRQADPWQADPRRADAWQADPRQADAWQADPRLSDPRLADPRQADPRLPDPRQADQRLSGSRPAGDALLRVENAVKHFPISRGVVLRKRVGAVKAVDGVSFVLRRGETLGLVGESGCGKSTLARLLMRLETPTAGRAYLDGRDIFKMRGSELRRLRRNMQMVMQDPYTSLNPRMTVADIVGEPFDIHPEAAPKGNRTRAVQELLELVGLGPEHANRYPHQFSGGQRQRIGIARAIALRPEVIICDEPVSALDVSIQAQVVNLLEKLQDELGLAYVFIAHDLSVVRHISDRIAVMYLGRVVETGTADEVYNRPTHPYTQALLSAVPVPDPGARARRQIIRLSGDVPSPADPPSGCRFRTRCWKAQERCATEEPPLVLRAVDPHPSACHYAERHHVIA